MDEIAVCEAIVNRPELLPAPERAETVDDRTAPTGASMRYRPEAPARERRPPTTDSR